MFSKIVVTGSGAVAGTAFRTLPHLESELVFMTSKDCDLTRSEDTLRYFEAHRPDAIIHLAAVSGGIGLSARHHARMLRDNVLMTLNLLETARLLEVKKLVMTLTAGAYPVDAPLPLREEHLHDGWPAANNYGSSFAKRLVDPAIRAYRAEYGLKVVGLIPGGIFGENDNFNLDDAPMVPALIRRCYEAKLHGSEVVIWGDGTPRREYTYSGDIARIFLWALHHYDDDLPLNIGSTEEHSVGEIAGMIAEAVGLESERMVFDTSKPNGVFRRSTDNSRFLALSGFRYLPFREGLARTVRWFVDTHRRDPGSIRMHGKSRASR
jgi:GDP-L-fucose synthase